MIQELDLKDSGRFLQPPGDPEIGFAGRWISARVVVLCGWNVYVMRRGYHARQSVVDLIGMNHLLHITAASTTPRFLF
jgi:hypothetical protein